MKWCPGAADECARAVEASHPHALPGLGLLASHPHALPGLGLLAIAMGDGSVHVVAVPDPAAVFAAAAQGRVTTGAGAACSTARPKLRIVTVGVSGGRSLTVPFRDARRFPFTRW